MSSSKLAASTAASPSTSHEDSDRGMPMAAQVSIGVIVPVVCIILVFGLWMILFRRSKSRRLTMGDAPPGFYVVGPPGQFVVGPPLSPGDRPSSYYMYPSTPPPAYTPAYTKSATTPVSTVPAVSSAASSVFSNESPSPEQGMEMSNLSVPLSPCPLHQRLSVMDVRLSMASTMVGTPEGNDQAGNGPEADDVHPGMPIDLSRTSVFHPRSTVDQNVMGPGTAL
ncbi:hypothetical protein N0V85_005449 [Neurospora sp. IMI 360204]|nr:hypothetical protein N0V85_005449 [Neurospora sp. IMI 360204]